MVRIAAWSWFFATVLGIGLSTLATDARAAFDVDGSANGRMNAARAERLGRVAWSANVVRLAGYGDQCTAYAMDRMHDATGQWLGVRGDALEWADEARQAGWRVGRVARPRSVMVMPSAPGYRYTIRELEGLIYETPMHPSGHVAWVETVEGDWALVRDQNWRRGEIGARWVFVRDSPLWFIYSR